MPIDLRIRWDLSMMDLLAKLRAGFVVFKTPHVGNWYTNNLVCAQLGIPMKVVDSTKGCLDRNFHPHCVIVDGQRHIVANEDLLTTHTVVAQTPPVMSERFPVGTSMSDAHMLALREAISNIQAQTMTQYFHMHSEKVMDLMEVLTQADPLIWARYVHNDGRTENRRVHAGWKEVVVHGILGINGARSGWLSPNVANILTDVMIDPSLHDTDTIYELSGPDMYRYIGDLMPRLNALYDLARARLSWKLPETVTLNLVPVSDMRFAVPARKRSELTFLIETWQKTCASKVHIAERMKNAKDKKTLIAVVETERQAVRTELMDAVRACPEPFYNIYDGTFFSQYDLLSETEPLFIHPWALETPMSELAKAIQTMRGCLS